MQEMKLQRLEEIKLCDKIVFLENPRDLKNTIRIKEFDKVARYCKIHKICICYSRIST